MALETFRWEFEHFLFPQAERLASLTVFLPWAFTRSPLPARPGPGDSSRRTSRETRRSVRAVGLCRGSRRFHAYLECLFSYLNVCSVVGAA